jgi:hypothetical protein
MAAAEVASRMKRQVGGPFYPAYGPDYPGYGPAYPAYGPVYQDYY